MRAPRARYVTAPPELAEDSEHLGTTSNGREHCVNNSFFHSYPSIRSLASTPALRDVTSVPATAWRIAKLFVATLSC